MNDVAALRLGVGGPVGSGKTALVAELCRRLGGVRDLRRHQRHLHPRGRRVPGAGFGLAGGPGRRGRDRRLPAHRVRDDVSMNLVAIEALEKRFPNLDLVFFESGGDNLAASFSPELVDASIYVIDVAGGDKVPRKGGPGVVRSELLVVNKTDLAPLVGADLSVMERDAGHLRGETPTLFASVLHGDGMGAVVGWVREAVVHRRWIPVASHMEVDHHDHPHAH